jgi:hypothetical protein
MELSNGFSSSFSVLSEIDRSSISALSGKLLNPFSAFNASSHASRLSKSCLTQRSNWSRTRLVASTTSASTCPFAFAHLRYSRSLSASLVLLR